MLIVERGLPKRLANLELRRPSTFNNQRSSKHGYGLNHPRPRRAGHLLPAARQARGAAARARPAGSDGRTARDPSEATGSAQRHRAIGRRRWATEEAVERVPRSFGYERARARRDVT